jgi:hypothetical protein
VRDGDRGAGDERAALVREHRGGVGPPPDADRVEARARVEPAEPHAEAVGARRERGRAERAVDLLREDLDADVPRRDDHVRAAVARDVADRERARTVGVRAGGRVQDRRAERAVRELGQDGELEVDRRVQAVAGREHDVRAGVARDVADGDRIGLGRDVDGRVRREAAAGGRGGRHERQGDEERGRERGETDATAIQAGHGIPQGAG